MSKKFVINLDQSVELRYSQLIESFDVKKIKNEFNNLYDQIFNSMPLMSMALNLINNIDNSKIMYYDEIKYWSDIFEMSFHKVLLMQLIYEINSSCTTFVKDHIMYRTMDWPLIFLKEMTYHGIFTKNGNTIFEDVCWIGSVGIFTGKNNNYSIAINYRRVNEWSNEQIIQKFINTTNHYWPVSYLLRYALENEINTSDVIKLLKSAKLISPVYYIVNNFNDKSSIIMREPKKYIHIIKNNLVQTNCDNDKIKNQTGINIMHSYERYNFIKQLLKEEINDANNVINKSFVYPIKNEDTIYFCIMSKDIFEVII
jgi:hypothetical protein